jgi:hypothetical protein
MSFTEQILTMADEAYDDDCVSIVDAAAGIDVGDSLATFIGVEIQDVSKHYADLDSALHFSVEAMDLAIRQLQGVRDALAKE